jgi:TolB-like protein/class 3 adenylate cyclase/Tfp pilus assembly protein PilF
MATVAFARRLVAIIAADVAGYSRLIRQDEAGTVARLKELRSEVLEPALARHGGRIVDLKGDGGVFEFGSVADAVLAAIEIQNHLRERNAGVPDEQRIDVRIGINLGDVIVDGDAIYGDGINIAARIEGLCDPGGIWLSRSVYNQVNGRLDVEFEPTGRHRVKNIAEPIETWRVKLPAAGPAQAPRRTKPRLAWVRAAALAVAALAVFALGGWTIWERFAPAPAMAERSKPSIAVLPFDNLSGDPQQGYLADGIAEDIITELARNKDLIVIARHSAFSLRGSSMSVQEIAQKLGVLYVLEGSVRSLGEKLRIRAQLVEGQSGQSVWGQRYDRPGTEIIAVQDDIIRRIAGTLFAEIRANEQVLSLHRTPVANFNAYVLTMRGVALKHRFTAEDNAKAQADLEEALRLDPNYAPAHAYLANANLLDIYFKYSGKLTDKDIDREIERLRLAQKLDRNLAISYQVLSLALRMKGDEVGALSAAQRAVELGPSDAENLAMLARAQTAMGMHAEAAKSMEAALTVNPLPLTNYFTTLAKSYWAVGNYATAFETTTRCMERPPLFPACLVFRAVSLVSLGRVDEAQEMIIRLKELRPQATLQSVVKGNSYPNNPELNERLEHNLRVAGMGPPVPTQ